MEEQDPPMASHTEIQNIDIDEEGDILVACGSKELRVSSKILTLRSPVFKAMLKPGFREGNTARSQEHPLPLSLPDDNENALLVLFQVLHFGSARGSHPDIDLQLEITLLCHKYDCTTSIKNESRLWLFPKKNSHREIEDPDPLWKMVCITFLLDLDEEFQITATKLITKLSRADIDSLEMTHTLFQRLKGMILTLSHQ